MLDNLRKEIKTQITEYAISQKNVQNPDGEKRKLKDKLKKLKDLYLNDLIDLSEYRKDYESYQAELKKLDSVKRPEMNTRRLQRLLNEDFVSAYETLDREHKRAFWRSIIKEIYINDKREIVRIVFL